MPMREGNASTPGGEPPHLATLADKLNYLFATVRPPGGQREYANETVAQAVGVSGSYIHYLRKGERDNPTRSTIQGLARFFGVPAAYLIEDELDQERLEEINDQLRLLGMLNTAQVRAIAMRAQGVSTPSLKTVMEMLDRLRDLENLPPLPAATEPDDNAGR
jgi:ESX-1-secreted protein regulator